MHNTDRELKTIFQVVYMTKGYQADWNLISCLYMGWDAKKRCLVLLFLNEVWPLGVILDSEDSQRRFFRYNINAATSRAVKFHSI